MFMVVQVCVDTFWKEATDYCFSISRKKLGAELHGRRRVYTLVGSGARHTHVVTVK